jgi:hypothetical protein
MASASGGGRRLLRDVARGRPVDGDRLAGYLRRAAARQDRVRVEGARCTGPVDLTHARLAAHLELVDCVFDGQLRLDGAVLDSLDLTGSSLAALVADGIRVDGDLVLRGVRTAFPPSAVVPLSGPGTSSGDRVEAVRRVRDQEGEAPVRLVAARVEGDVVLEDAVLGGPGPWTLFAPRLTVGGSLRARAVRTPGALYLRDARVGHSVLLDGARVGAVDATNLRCDGGFYADWGFVCPGPVRLRGAEVAGIVTFHDALLTAPSGVAVLTRLRTARLRIDFRAPPAGGVGLRDARVGSCVDAPGSWPAAGALDVEGFGYDRIAASEPVGVRERLRWLARDRGATAGSFEQLAQSYQRAGEERSARLVRLARERRLRVSERLPGRMWGALQDVLFGYGYAPGRAFGWLVALVGAGSLWFATHEQTPVRRGARDWDPVLYALDLVVPFAGLGQRAAWDPAGADRAVAVTLILAGWLLATAVIAGASRTLGRH